jgi:hypothetical protein
LVDELRDEAARVKSEIDATRTRRDQFTRGAFGFLGMSLAIYGAASGNESTAVAGLLSVLGLLHADESHKHRVQTKAKNSPAYVLVKAREIVEHAD